MLFACKIWSFAIFFSNGTFEKVRVRIKKLKLNDPNLELAKTLSIVYKI